MSDQIIHLLVPKEFKVHCLPSRSAAGFAVTMEASKATCANCLTAYRRKAGKRTAAFKVAHTPDKREKRSHGDWSKRCAVCGSPIYQESPAEGYSCPSCGSSDSDE